MMDMKRVEYLEEFLFIDQDCLCWKEISEDDARNLIQTIKQQQETINKIEESWVDIEKNGSYSDTCNFYTVVQDILHDHHDALGDTHE